MSYSKEVFSSIREEETQEEYLQDWIFIEADRHEAFIKFERDYQEEERTTILVEENEIELVLPF